MSRSGKTTVTVAGVATVAAGALLVGQGARANDSNGNGVNEWSGNDDYSGPLLGSVLVVSGIVMALAGLTAREAEDAAPAPAPIAVQQPAVVVATPRLPELPVDLETLQLAKTMRTTALAGNCEATKLILERIATRAPAYSRAIVDGPVLDPCPQLRD